MAERPDDTYKVPKSTDGKEPPDYDGGDILIREIVQDQLAPIPNQSHKLTDKELKAFGDPHLSKTTDSSKTVDKATAELNAMSDLRKKIEKSTNLNPEQKQRLLNDYLPKLESREFIGKKAEDYHKERMETINQLARLLEKPEAGGYTEEECGKMLEQLAFHSAYQSNFIQAFPYNCNVADLAISLINESPSQLAKVMAEVGLTGSFRTKDGSIVTPRKLDIQAALRNQPFPPDPIQLGPTGISVAFDAIAANISWQRRTADDSKNPVAKGSLYYAQQGGLGVFYDKDGQRYYANNRWGKPIANETLIRPEDTVDIAEQITGETWTNRILVSQNLTADTKPAWAGVEAQHKRLVSISTIEDLHKSLLADQTQILFVHGERAPFYYDSGNGNDPAANGAIPNYHVVVKTKYYPVYDANHNLDLQKSVVCVDNSLPVQRADRLTPERGIPLITLYNAIR